ncbi:MAG: ribbon-helix-helix domain-containing protein [Hyphomicrobiales bacterium]|nr:ribbon-helix-helix domain-containing protein [Hyphomicrobiales bacterium]
MTDGPIKRSITIAGHRTSLSLEEEFWTVLKTLAAANNMSIAQLIATIDEARGGRNLSSAVRVFVLNSLTKISDQS